MYTKYLSCSSQFQCNVVFSVKLNLVICTIFSGSNTLKFTVKHSSAHLWKRQQVKRQYFSFFKIYIFYKIFFSSNLHLKCFKIAGTLKKSLPRATFKMVSQLLWHFLPSCLKFDNLSLISCILWLVINYQIESDHYAI